MGTATVLVTGGNGFIARHCVARLLDDGWSVRVTLRREADFAALKSDLAEYTGIPAHHLPLEYAVADLDSDENWAEATAGIRYALHLAACMPAGLSGDAAHAAVSARRQMERLVGAFIESKVEKVVHTSSIAAICYGTDDCTRIFDERDWTDTDHAANNPYTIGKTVAERTGWNLTASYSAGPRWTAVCPAVVLGPPIGRAAGPGNEIVRLLISGKMRAIPRLGHTIVDVRDVADLILSAMTSSASDLERFAAATDYCSLRDISERIASAFPDLVPRLPKQMMNESLMHIAARMNPVLRNELLDLGVERRVSSAKARAQLGWRTRPATATIAETVQALLRLNGEQPTADIEERP